ncbi:hypothetical protein ES332_A06G184100v1 [Gossypium tomentosum]|uniref:Uncharacterized protein n=1 Tax=Gossypium tomentosum TaxID=34277 RepID=A0A5D2Q5F8_GOSTO|nr:hypothetical protein ES332_A06G184100v1 [Gossypium tomentosum]
MEHPSLPNLKTKFPWKVQCWAFEEDSIRHTLCSHHI